MPQPACANCQRFVALALQMSCQETTPGNCDELVAAWQKNCEALLHKGAPVDPDICALGSRILGELCAHVGTDVICQHIDEIASIICHAEGACP